MSTIRDRLAEAVEAITMAAGQDISRLTSRLADQIADSAGIGGDLDDEDLDDDEDEDDSPSDPQVWLVVCGSADEVAATMAKVIVEASERLAAMATVAALLAGEDRPSLGELGLRVALLDEDGRP